MFKSHLISFSDYLIEDNSLEIDDKEIEKYSLNIGSKIVFVNGELWQKPEIHGVKIQVNAFNNLNNFSL